MVNTHRVLSRSDEMIFLPQEVVLQTTRARLAGITPTWYINTGTGKVDSGVMHNEPTNQCFTFVVNSDEEGLFEILPVSDWQACACSGVSNENTRGLESSKTGS